MEAIRIVKGQITTPTQKHDAYKSYMVVGVGCIRIDLLLYGASPTRFTEDAKQFQQIRHCGQTIASDVRAAFGFASELCQYGEDILDSDGIVTIDVSCAIVEDAAAIVHNRSWIEVQSFAVGAAFLPQLKGKGTKYLFLAEWKTKDGHPSIDADVNPKGALKRRDALQIHTILVASNEAAGIPRIAVVVAHHFQACIRQ